MWGPSVFEGTPLLVLKGNQKEQFFLGGPLNQDVRTSMESSLAVPSVVKTQGPPSVLRTLGFLEPIEPLQTSQC